MKRKVEDDGKETKKRSKQETVLMFNSKSADAAPGQGAKETLAPTDDFAALRKIKNWRKVPAAIVLLLIGVWQVLSAFYVTKEPFRFRGRLYSSYEAAHHAHKFLETAPHVARLFEADSGSVFCNVPLWCKMAGGKKGVVTEKRDGKRVTVYRRPSDCKANLVLDSQTRFDMLMAKFSSDQLAKQVLLATEQAQLTHWTRGMTTVHVDVEMMRVRQVLRDH